MKILIVTNCFPSKLNKSSGIYTYYRVRALQKLNIEVEVILLNSCISRKLNLKYCSHYNTKDLNMEEPCDINVTVINYIRIPFIYEFVLGCYILKHVAKFKCDVVHFHFLWSVFGYKKLLKHNVPYVITCHGSDIHQLYKRSKRQQMLYLEHLAFAKHVIFVSKYLCNNVKQLGFKGTNYSVIRNGININVFKYSKKDFKQQFNVGYFGNMYLIKRVHLLPEIFFKVKQKLGNVAFMICGDGPYVEIVKRKINELNMEDNVSFFPGFTHKELVGYLKLIDVIVMPSKLEGFPCIPLEAKAMGVPTVGSNNGGLPESIGAFGKLINDGPHMVEAFAESIVDILHNPFNADDLVENARQFSWENIVKKEISVYRECV